MESIVDLTHRIDGATLPYPGDPAPVFESAAQIDSDECRVTKATLATHTGTHVDAPAHVMSAGRSLTDYPLDAFFGTACLVDVRDCAGTVDASVLEGISKRDWLLVCTGQSLKWGTSSYFRDGPVFTEAFVRRAAELVRKGIALDCSGFDVEGVRLHRIWFAATDALIVENLADMEHLLGRTILRFAAFPMKIDAVDGAPVRALTELRIEE